jgi:DNA-binding transcriptional LysR family regulator
MELDNIDATKKMVAQGLGVAFLPRAALDDELAAGTLATTAISDAEPLRRPIVAMTRSGSGPLSGPAQAFLELLLGLELPGVAAKR